MKTLHNMLRVALVSGPREADMNATGFESRPERTMPILKRRFGPNQNRTKTEPAYWNTASSSEKAASSVSRAQYLYGVMGPRVLTGMSETGESGPSPGLACKPGRNLCPPPGVAPASTSSAAASRPSSSHAAPRPPLGPAAAQDTA